ncbi:MULTISPECIES: bifunctional aspartate transaminase/aspartate 4-decarboxylase [unclassified Ruegeria]|uniref:bifunctional aspartate transaminase/aspartate 4-decarboxylase n=1 Tax=unclassified Ruegeria TaxID=2625375 RepID=UPI0014923389|nr:MULTISPECIES: bifunctional aspartate transaminase/aspartate 4-decarboxylase [unclassified Ruegeria]NOD47558.1 bifunctional aspartate transaminase/aspartate 4-decarboxylase [Ruegeria sp. HKCCD5849]NOD52779.1 bifunctional aspartate transaminase/aspartate 4-decarboxylase [Ruegeria sp. HKCCD5851]NOD66198.1 bifunctional aspartate transaminase/aspartate 4-decarboxylase [Ruegeria sp. HKCCD7303]
MDRLKLHDYEALSPFQIKDELIKLASDEARKSNSAFLNAGRGNPNWIATRPREAFFALGQFAVTEAKRVMDHPAGLGGMPAVKGCHDRLLKWAEVNADMPGTDTLLTVVKHAIFAFDFNADAFVHELTDSIIGDNYPVPDRILHHNQIIAHEYLMWAMCSGRQPDARFDLFAVEGGTAAMCYIFKSLKANRLLNPGDTIALCTPIFTPYLEMPELEDYSLESVHVETDEEDAFQLTDAAVETLKDPKVKAFFLVNPGNPSSVALNKASLEKLADVVENHRPDLIVLTDDVYGTFVHDFTSVMGYMPRNTIGVYSYSKYFGCTGWRLGVIAVAQDNIFDLKLAEHSEQIKQALDKRYGTLSLTPREIRFIDRLVADSRDVALNHTAGLSLPQQVMMTLFSLVELVDTKKDYQTACMELVHRRFKLLTEAMGIEVNAGENYDAYYGIIDFEYWLRKYVGEDVVAWIKKNVHPLDIAFKLAEDHGIVLLNGSGFDAPGWSARVSFANLPDEAYAQIGRAVRSVARGYVEAYRAANKMPLHGGS